MSFLRRLLGMQKPANRIEGDIVDLYIEHINEAGQDGDTVHTVYYGIYIHGTYTRVGYCDLRAGMNEELYYAGNIGYHIFTRYRGHGYAREATKLLLAIAAEKFGMEEVLITCSPDNMASHRTLEHLGGEKTDTVDVPSWHWLYRRGEKVKEIYRFRIH